jgi:predicted oxidoreductase
MMKTQKIGKSDLVSSRLSYGCMRVAGVWDPKKVTPALEAIGKKAIVAAYEAGYTLFDHADIYAQGACESIFGKVLTEVSGMREEILIATKCGIRFKGDPTPDAPHRFDFSFKHIIWSCEQSLKRLGIDRVDIYQLHRPDYLADPEEIAKAFTQLKQQGKVREFGVSNFKPSLLTAVQKVCPMPLIVNQVEISLAHLNCFEDGTLDQCLTENITPLSWSPLAGGLLGDGGKPQPKDHRKKGFVALLKLMDKMAKKLGVSRTVLSLAWLLKHPGRIIPVVGTVKPDRIKDAVKADKLDLSREDWYTLMVAARMEGLP